MKTMRAFATTFFALVTYVGYGQFNMLADIQTNHLWRGSEVAAGVVVTSEASADVVADRLVVGVWGGTNTHGTYKEFNYFARYKSRGFTVELWDKYNFSEYATYNHDDFFCYSASSTGRFLDATIAHRFGPQLPLKVSWSTILFGRDRNSENTANRYSTFISVEYPIYHRDGWRLDAGVGGAFAIVSHGERANFYGSDPGVVDIRLKLSHDLVVCNYTIPISFTTMWNPQSSDGVMELAAQVFSF